MNVFRDKKLQVALLILALGVPLGFSRLGSAHPATPAAAGAGTEEKPFVAEYYYKAKWGHADEFITLFRKNHYPVLKKEIELGRILEVHAVQPRFHTTENGRWDYRVTIVFKNSAIANDDFDTSGIIKQLYPDQETYKKEEQRRFEILDGHWDLPIKDVDLTAK
ncbi:MAG: hypothetical protein WBR26_16350 [Candidatus Acidiferrum sp.]